MDRERREDGQFGVFLLVSIIFHALLVILYPQWQASAIPASIPLGEGALQLSMRQSPDAVFTPPLRPVTPQMNEPRPQPRPEPRPEPPQPVQDIPQPPQPEVRPEPRPVEQPAPPQPVATPAEPLPQVQPEPRPAPQPERVQVERPEPRPEPVPEPRPEPRPEPQPVPEPQPAPEPQATVTPEPEPSAADLLTSDSGRSVVASSERSESEQIGTAPEVQAPSTGTAAIEEPDVEPVRVPEVIEEPVEDVVVEDVVDEPFVPPTPPPPPPPPPEPPLASAMLRLPGAQVMPKDIVLTSAETIRLWLTVDEAGNIVDVEFDPETISSDPQANRFAELHARHNFTAQPSPDGRPYQVQVSVTFDPNAPGDRGLRFSTNPLERIRFLGGD